MPLKRRDFLKIGGGASLSLPLLNCVSGKVYNSTSQSNWLAAVEHWIPSTCQACPGGCGILVRVLDDRAVKIEGNPLHPLNRGKVCAKGQAGLQLLYNPQRIKTPLKRKGGRKSGAWEAIGWDEALDTLADRLIQLRSSGLAHTLAYVGDFSKQTSDDLVSRFFQVYGSPNKITLDEWASLKQAYFETQGLDDLLAFDLENTKYILSFGAGFLTNWPNSMENQRIFGEKRANRDLKILQIEPRFSIEASRADNWIPLKPGTEGLLALGIASVMIKENLYNSSYINKFTIRFEGLKNFLTEEIRLDLISDRTGIPLRSIIETAKEFASTKPAVAMADYNMSYQENGLFNLMAVHTLNALVGNIDNPGGILRQRPAPLGEMPNVYLDETARKGMAETKIGDTPGNNSSLECTPMNGFLDAIKNKDPYALNVLFLAPQTPHLLSFMARTNEDLFQDIPFIVSFSSFLDEVNAQADMILPDTSYFEKWQDFQVSSLSKVPIVGISKPVLKPLYQSKPFEETLLTLAKKMGPDFAQNFPWSDPRELIFSRVQGLYNTKRGSIFSPRYQEDQLRLLEERGWWISQYDNQNSFWNDIVEKGGWQDPAFHFNERSYMYQTSSRRFVFQSSFQPEDFEVPSSDQKEKFPFQLYLYDLPLTASENGAVLPWFQENLGFRFNSRWKTWMEINPEAADKLGIRDKDMVRVESSNGTIEATARIFTGSGHEVVGIPSNLKEIVPEEMTFDKKNDPAQLIVESFDRQTGMKSRNSTRVRVVRL